mmetsp:Transcript_16767/g.36458  ORF Transcript_16767/g.36458 Transcript_16767/m.36458 type:complete len:264 (+) Transcript_16767:4417-5208(+)
MMCVSASTQCLWKSPIHSCMPMILNTRMTKSQRANTSSRRGMELSSACTSTRSFLLRLTVRSGRSRRTVRMARKLPIPGTYCSHVSSTTAKSSTFQGSRRYAVLSTIIPYAVTLITTSRENSTAKTGSALFDIRFKVVSSSSVGCQSARKTQLRNTRPVTVLSNQLALANFNAALLSLWSTERGAFWDDDAHAEARRTAALVLGSTVPATFSLFDAVFTTPPLVLLISTIFGRALHPPLLEMLTGVSAWPLTLPETGIFRISS